MKLLSAAAVRRCFIADPGYSIFSCDFDQVELRVIAGLAQEKSMLEAAKAGISLHLNAANKLFGKNHTPDQYKLSKNINFTWAFGGGAGKMVSMYGISWEQARELIANYERSFPALVQFKRTEQNKILRSALNAAEYKRYQQIRSQMFGYRADTREGRQATAALKLQLARLTYRRYGYVTTPFGRRLIVDAEKPYTVVNYQVQSSAADIMKTSFLRVMDDDELEPYALLPVHDEIIGQAPKAEAEYIAKRYAEVMTTEFLSVPITASGKVYGKSWGHGYR
jgi:DNA polymerase-1